MIIDTILENCDERHNCKSNNRCDDCSYGQFCPGDCAKCLEYIHYPSHAETNAPKRKYDCTHMADFYMCKYSYRYTSIFSNFCTAYTSNSFVFSRGGDCLLCSFFAASSCARMDGFFGFAARDFLAFGAFSSALTAAARSVREICSPAFAFASNSPREGALFNTPSIMFSFCSVESSAVRSGFSRKNSGTCWKPTLSQ